MGPGGKPQILPPFLLFPCCWLELRGERSSTDKQLWEERVGEQASGFGVMEWNKSPYQVAGKRYQPPPPPDAELIKQETNLVARYRGSNGSDHQRVASRPTPSLASMHQDPSPSMAFLTSVSMGMDQQQQQQQSNALDMQHFDENVTVDLQQLFPSNGHNSSVLPPQQQQPMQSHYHHLPVSFSELYAGHAHQQQQSPVEEKPEPQYPHQQLFQSLQPSGTGPAMNECYFGESAFPVFHTEPSYGFSQQLQQQQQHHSHHHQGQSAMLDDRGELADINDASSLEIQEMSNLLNPVVTPPYSSNNSARVSMVSPLHADPGASRALLMREDDQDAGAQQTAVSMAMGFGAMAGIGHVCAVPKFSADRRKLCIVEDCKSQARAFNRCKRHGGSKRCSQPGCTKSVQSRGLCIRHGGGSRCQEADCTRAAQSHGHCKMHGGGRPCIVTGCDKKAHLKRLCRKHGGGAKCNVPGCDKWAQRQGMCMTHAKHVNGADAPRRPKRALPGAAAFEASGSMQL